MIRFYFILFLFFSCRLFADVDADYESALRLLELGKHKASLVAFQRLQIHYPFSTQTMSSELKLAEIYYMLDNYNNTIAAAENYIRLHPFAQDLDRAYYLRAMSGYHEISSVDLDQSVGSEVLTELEAFVVAFPDSEYVGDVILCGKEVRNMFAAKELYIAGFYLKRREYVSALIRFINVIESYKDTKYYSEAAYNAAKIYNFLGLHEEAEYILSNI